MLSFLDTASCTELGSIVAMCIAAVAAAAVLQCQTRVTCGPLWVTLQMGDGTSNGFSNSQALEQGDAIKQPEHGLFEGTPQNSAEGQTPLPDLP